MGFRPQTTGRATASLSKQRWVLHISYIYIRRSGQTSTSWMLDVPQSWKNWHLALDKVDWRKLLQRIALWRWRQRAAGSHKQPQAKRSDSG
jgi:hypothetical protein